MLGDSVQQSERGSNRKARRFRFFKKKKKGLKMIRKCLPLVAVLVGLLLLGLFEIAVAQSQPQVIDDSQLHALSATIGGASVLPTTRTVRHWFGSTLDPHDGVTYG